MKNTFTSTLRETFELAKRYISLQADVVKLTATEKMTLLLSGLTLGLFLTLCGGFILLLLSFAAADLFKEIMCPALAYTATAGVVLVIAIVVYLLRRPLLVNPIAKLLSKLILTL